MSMGSPFSDGWSIHGTPQGNYFLELYIKVNHFTCNTFILCPQQEDIQVLLNNVNLIRSSIKFTKEQKIDKLGQKGMLKNFQSVTFLEISFRLQNINILILGNGFQHPFILITCIKQEFKTLIYCKSVYAVQYLSFDSHHQYSICCLHDQEKLKSGDPDAYQEEMISYYRRTTVLYVYHLPFKDKWWF